MSSFTPKRKFIIHPHIHKQSNPRSTNIFLNHKNHSTALENFTMYSIVGDPDFKDKFYRQRSHMSTTQAKLSNKTLDETMNETFCQYTRSKQNKTLTSKLSLDKQLQVTHDERTMAQVKNHKNREKKIDSYIKFRCNKSKFSDTVTFGSIQQIYAHPNPEKDELINENIPQYWKNSLRDNQKRLKRHLKGNSFKRQVAEEMLQTLKGRKMLQNSIPKIKEEFRSIVCAKTLPKQKRNNRKKGFSLLGRRISQYQTLQDTSFQKIQLNFKTCAFDEVHKLQYDAGRRWKANEL